MFDGVEGEIWISCSMCFFLVKVLVFRSSLLVIRWPGGLGNRAGTPAQAHKWPKRGGCGWVEHRFVSDRERGREKKKRSSLEYFVDQDF
jgi:hypothetical protein